MTEPAKVGFLKIINGTKLLKLNYKMFKNKTVEKKRTRSENWQLEDKNLLKELVRGYYSIIENKKTDTLTNNAKQQAWKAVLTRFNQRTKGGYRTMAQIRIQWRSLKMYRQKALARRKLMELDGEPSAVANVVMDCPLLDEDDDEEDESNNTIRLTHIKEEDLFDHQESDVSEDRIKPTPHSEKEKMEGGDSAANEILCRLELHALQMETERLKQRNLEMEYEILKEKYKYVKHKNKIRLIAKEYSVGGRFLCSVKALVKHRKCNCGYSNKHRIVNGNVTQVNEFPMMVGLIFKESDNQIRCGGVIIDRRYVMTAAHCLLSTSIDSVTIAVGEHDVNSAYETPATRLYKVAQIIMHEKFNADNMDYDIALLRTTTNIQFSQLVGPVCLPFKYKYEEFNQETVTMLGWGSIEFGGPTSSVLRNVNVHVIPQGLCKQHIRSLTDRQICTYEDGKDACQNDSGGPVIWKNPLTGLLYSVGIVSYGSLCATEVPSVNTRVTSLLRWIIQHTPYVQYCKV